MGNSKVFDLKCLRHGRQVLACTILPNGTSAPSITGSPPGFASVARSSEGVFLLTLRDRYYVLEGASVTLMLNAASEVVGELATEAVNNATPTVTIRTSDKATGLVDDIAAHANNRIHVMLFVRNTAK